MLVHQKRGLDVIKERSDWELAIIAVKSFNKKKIKIQARYIYSGFFTCLFLVLVSRFDELSQYESYIHIECFLQRLSSRQFSTQSEAFRFG